MHSCMLVSLFRAVDKPSGCSTGAVPSRRPCCSAAPQDTDAQSSARGLGNQMSAYAGRVDIYIYIYIKPMHPRASSRPR
jgi:hypothetical protein